MADDVYLYDVTKLSEVKANFDAWNKKLNENVQRLMDEEIKKVD